MQHTTYVLLERFLSTSLSCKERSESLKFISWSSSWLLNQPLELTKGLLSDFRTSYLTNFGKKLIKSASERINLMLHNEGLLEHFFKLLIFSKVFWRCFTLINWNWVKKWKIPWSMANHIYHMMNYSFYWTHSKLQRFSFLTPIFLKVCVL